MKNINIFLLISIFFSNFALSQFPCDLPDSIYRTDVPSEAFHNSELQIYNQSKYWNSLEGTDVRVRIIPTGGLMNGDFLYTPNAKHVLLVGQSKIITGYDTILPIQSSSNSKLFTPGNFDFSNGGNCNFAFGYGRYKIEFYIRNYNIPPYPAWELVNYLYIDFRDASDYHLPIEYNDLFDIRIDFFNKDTITFQHSPKYLTDSNHVNKFWNINYVNKEIKMWNLFGTCLPTLNPDKGSFFTDSSENGKFLKWPINANKYNGNIGHENPGDLGMNLVINHYVTTQDTLIENPTNILTAKNGFLKIASGKTFDMITAVNGSNNLIVQDSSALTLSSYSHLIVRAQNKLTLRRFGKITFLNNSEIYIANGGLFCNEGGLIRGRGTITFQGTHFLCSQLADLPFGDSTKVVLLDSAILEIPDSTILHFTGKQSGLVMNPHSKLKMGIGSKIIFDSSASIYADGAEFSSTDSSEKWEGIFLTNSDADTIVNCTFSNAKTALTIINNPNNSESISKNRIIKDNIFNVPSGGVHMGIYGENNYRILIQNNKFNMPVYYPSGSPVSLIYAGIYLKNNNAGGAASEPEEFEESPFSLNIVENTFSNGCASVILTNYMSNYLPYLIKHNIFNNTTSANLIGLKITGTIRDNNFTSDDVPLGIHLINSSPNLYKNTIASRDVGIHLSGHCYPNLAPYVSGDDLVWTGGNNNITTEEYDNIQFSSSGYVMTDFGNNNFTVENSSSFNIYGWLDSIHTIYNARDNCGNSSGLSKIYLKKYGTSDTIPVPVINSSNYNCTSEASAGSWIVTYNGNGIYDSVKVSIDNTEVPPTVEEIMYAQAKADASNGFHGQAIIVYKYLFDNYPGYTYAASTLYTMYECYQALDTNNGQNYREPLYQNIIDYLNAKILSTLYDNNKEFLDNAYEIILMAQSIIDLNAAAGGYEFLAFNHPDPDIRLAASWNYAEIEELLNLGNGGGSKQLGIENYELGIEENQELNEIKKLNELITNDPVMSKMKKSFEKTSASIKTFKVKTDSSEKKSELDKVLGDRSENSKSSQTNQSSQLQKKANELDKIKIDKAKRNIFDARTLSKKR